MKVFFDVELTSVNKDAEIMSIACIADSEAFYGVSTDFNKANISEEVRNTALQDLHTSDITVSGSLAYLENKLSKWLSHINDITWCGDNATREFNYLVDLLKLDTAVYHELNQDIATYLGMSECKAKKFSRELLLSDANVMILGKTYNGLRKAAVSLAISEIIATNEYSCQIERGITR